MQRSVSSYGYKGPLKHIVLTTPKVPYCSVWTDAYLQNLTYSSTTQHADRKALGCKLISEKSFYLKNPREIRRKGLWRVCKNRL